MATASVAAVSRRVAAHRHKAATPIAAPKAGLSRHRDAPARKVGLSRRRVALARKVAAIRVARRADARTAGDRRVADRPTRATAPAGRTSPARMAAKAARPDGGYNGGRPDGGYDRGRPGGGYQQGRPNGGGGGDWNRGWRGDQRYNWQGYRDSHRDAYRIGRYRPPSGYGWGYRRYGIGAALEAGFFGRDYWIGNPGYYRLPPAYGPYRWVRYYNDALLVNVYNGYIADEIPDFFW